MKKEKINDIILFVNKNYGKKYTIISTIFGNYYFSIDFYSQGNEILHLIYRADFYNLNQLKNILKNY